MSLEILLEAALFLEQQQSQGEEPKDYGKLEQTLPEEANDAEGRAVGYSSSSGGASRGVRDGTILSVLSNGGFTSTASLRDQPAEIIGSHKLSSTTSVVGNGASVIQRLGPSTIVPSTISGGGPLNGSRGGSSAAALYSYNSDERIRSPSPAQVYCNGKETSTSPPLITSNNVINGNTASGVRNVYPSSPSTSRVPLDASDHNHSVQLHQQQASQYGSVSSSNSSSPYNRLDDLASRSHRLEEALLRASTSRRSPTTTSSPANLAAGATSSQFHAIHTSNTSTATGGAGGGSSGGGGRNSATDELQELKKRSGAGTREVHNKLEKNRRAHLRECFEVLRKQLPAVDDKKLSNLGILKSALRYIQTLKRKEREYEHTMERLAREKIAAQQRLATLRKDVSSIPGCSADPGLLDLGSVLPVLHQSQQPHLEHAQSTSSHLTFANVQAHNMREESKNLGNNAKIGVLRDEHQDQDDRESNSTSTASERGDLSDHEDDEKSFQEAYRRQHRPPHLHRTELPPSSSVLDYGHRRSPAGLPNGRVVSPGPYSSHNSNSCDSFRGVKRSFADDESASAPAVGGPATLAGGPPPPPPLPATRDDNSRPHFRYVKAATSAGGASGQPTFLTMTSSAGAHVLELAAASSTPPSDAGSGGKVEASSGLFAVRQPIAFATTTPGNSLSAHVQLGPQVLSTHHHAAGVQLFPSLKVLAPSSMAGVRVISADGAASSIQPLVAVHPSPSVPGTKGSEEVSTSVLNGTSAAAATTAGSFCIPAGVVIPSLVALPPESVASSSAGTPSAATSPAAAPTGFEQLAAAVRTSSGPQQLKHAPTISSSSTVLSLQNGLLKGTVNRSIAIQPSTTAGVTHVMTPLNVTARSLPLVTSMAVMQPAKHVAHIIANPTLEKVAVASPLLKTGSGIPTIITGGQYLTSPALSGRHVIKPLMVVAAPPPPPPQPSSSPPTPSSSTSTSSSSASCLSVVATPPSREAVTSAPHSAPSDPSPSSSTARSSPSPPSKSS